MIFVNSRAFVGFKIISEYFTASERTMKVLALFAAIFGSVICISNVAGADDVGYAEYVSACAACHGVDGRGDGPIAESLTVEVPALTGLSAANEGAFPMLKVIHAIDGRQSIRGHGNPMPVWGQQFEVEAAGYGPYGGEAVVRGRVLSIAYYLEAIQE